MTWIRFARPKAPSPLCFADAVHNGIRANWTVQSFKIILVSVAALNNNPYPPDIEAEITFLTTKQGGRKGPAFSGFRPQFYYDGHDWDATHEYPDVESVLPGQTVRTLLWFMSPHKHLGRVYPNMEFEIREGARTIAHGRIKQIINLEDSAKRVGSKRLD